MACSIFLYKVAGRINDWIYIWPTTGLQLGLLLPAWSSRRSRITGQVAGSAGVLLGGVLIGLPPWFALSIALISAADVWLSGAILSRGIRSFDDLKRSENLWRFVIAGTLAPALCGFVSALPLTILLQQKILITTALSFLADLLGIAVVLPAMLLLLKSSQVALRPLSHYLRRDVPIVVFFVLVTGLVFWQMSNPLLFMVFPPMVLVVLNLGLEGSVYASVAIAAIAGYATAHGHGPLWLVRTLDSERRLLILQIFVWMSVATALPIGALLDERRRAQRAADEARHIYTILLEHTEDMII